MDGMNGKWMMPIMIRSKNLRTVFMAGMALLGWFALLLQFYLMPNAPKGKPIGNFFGYFTILTNLLVALCFTVVLLSPSSRAGRFFSRPAVQSGIALYIGIVGLVYSLALRALWDPQGWQKTADMILHDIIPVLYLVYWIFFVLKGSLKWKDVLTWLIYPLIYIIYTTIRGAVTGWYPYPFIDVNTLGYAHTLRNTGILLIAFTGVGLLLIGIDRLISRLLRRPGI